MVIREATPADYPRIAEVTLAAYRALDRWVGDDYATTMADVAARAAPGSGATLLVAEDGTGRVVGAVTLVLEAGPYFEWEFGIDGDCGFRMLAVDPAAQGGGIGPALVSECLRRAADAGKKRMVLGSTEWMTTAHRMYERFGFRRRPDLDQMWGDIRGLCFMLDLPEPKTDEHDGEHSSP